MKKIVFVLLMVFFLAACGGDSSESSSLQADSKIFSQTSDSPFLSHMNKDSICNLISTQAVQKSFNTTQTITVKPSEHKSKYSNSVSCQYSWNRADEEERKEKFLTYIVDQMQGKIKKTPMRQRALEHNFSLRLESYSGNPKSIMPAKLTEKQLQKQISHAKKRAAERLTDEQKKIAGKAANSMMVSLLRRNNENIKIEGVGDSAFWTSVGKGSLNILSGNAKIILSPMIGNTLEEDVNNAKKIAQLLMSSSN